MQRASAPPAEPITSDASGPSPRERFRFPDDAVPPAERALLAADDPVDADAVLAWLAGDGPDPWQRAGSR